MTTSHPRTGFTIAEVLVSLVILAMLMTAVAVAASAWFQSYNYNQQVSAVTQTARSILQRMMGEVRTAEAVNSSSTELIIDPPEGEGVPDRITYDYLDNVLYYRQLIDGSTTSYVLLGSDDDVAVDAFHVTREVDGEGRTVSVTARLVLSIDNQTLGVTASSAVRRNQEY